MNEDKAEPFETMARRISAAADGEFAGAVVIVPPGDGASLEFMAVEAGASPDHFWNLVKLRVTLIAADVEERIRTGDPFGNRRR